MKMGRKEIIDEEVIAKVKYAIDKKIPRRKCPKELGITEF
jgi:hypothetical protein